MRAFKSSSTFTNAKHNATNTYHASTQRGLRTTSVRATSTPHSTRATDITTKHFFSTLHNNAISSTKIRTSTAVTSFMSKHYYASFSKKFKHKHGAPNPKSSHHQSSSRPNNNFRENPQPNRGTHYNERDERDYIIEDYEKRFQQLQEVISKQSFDYETLWAALGATLNPFQITKLQLLLSAMKRGDMEETQFRTADFRRANTINMNDFNEFNDFNDFNANGPFHRGRGPNPWGEDDVQEAQFAEDEYGDRIIDSDVGRGDTRNSFNRRSMTDENDMFDDDTIDFRGRGRRPPMHRFEDEDVLDSTTGRFTPHDSRFDRDDIEYEEEFDVDDEGEALEFADDEELADDAFISKLENTTDENLRTVLTNMILKPSLLKQDKNVWVPSELRFFRTYMAGGRQPLEEHMQAESISDPGVKRELMSRLEDTLLDFLKLKHINSELNTDEDDVDLGLVQNHLRKEFLNLREYIV